MPSPRGSEPRPLTVWAWTLGLMAVFALVVAFVPHRDTAIYQAYEKRIANFAATPPGRPKVVLIGTSLAYRAIPTGREVEWVFKRKGENVRFLKLARPRAVLEFYEPLLGSILDLEPDLLLVHAESIRTDPWRSITDARASFLLALQGKTGGYGWHIDPPGFRSCRIRQSEKFLARTANNVEVGFRDFEGLLPAARDLFDEARARGIPVAVLELARSRPLIDATGDLARLWRDQLFEELGPWPEVMLLSFEQELPLNHFCDYSHYNERGRARFLDWFVPRIYQILEEDGA